MFIIFGVHANCALSISIKFPIHRSWPAGGGKDDAYYDLFDEDLTRGN